MHPVQSSILSKIVAGYDEIEPCILAACALGAGNHIFIEGTHGVGKTTIGKVLGLALDPTGRGFRYFPADKADMVSIGGFPNTEAMKRGLFEFIKTNQSIFGGKVVVIDELTRANKDGQNIWLEILEEGTFKGIKHGVEMFIATGNTTTYSGTMDTDLALRSRFMFWLPAPNFNAVQSETVENMIALNFARRGGFSPEQMQPFAEELREMINDMRREIDKLVSDPDYVSQITSFVGTYIQLLSERIGSSVTLADNDDAFITPREFAAQLPMAITGLTAYYKVKGFESALQMAGEMAVKYNIETRHATAGEEFASIADSAWKQTMGMLVSNIDTPEGKMEMQFARCLNGPQKLQFWREHLDEAIDTLPAERLTELTAVTLQQVRADSIEHVGLLWNVMNRRDETKFLASQVEGLIMTETCRLIIRGYDGGQETGQLYDRYFQANEINDEGVADILSFSTQVA